MSRDDLYYVKPTVKAGDSISWGSLSRDPEVVDYEFTPESRMVRVTYEGKLFTPIPYCTFGDYDNSTATERSNHRVIHAEFPWLVHVYGDYGSEMIGYIGKRENQNPALLERIEELERYPVADEDDSSELETELEWEGWCDWGRRDFAKDLIAVLDEIDPSREHEIDIPTDDSDPARDHKLRNGLTLAIDELWWRGTDVLNVNGGSGMTIESGGNVHFFVDDWIEKAARDPQEHRYGDKVFRSEFEVREMLLALAHRCGVIRPKCDDELDLYVQRALVAMWLGWNGTESPRELVKQCTDVESCSVLGDYLDEHMPTEAPARQTEMLL